MSVFAADWKQYDTKSYVDVSSIKELKTGLYAVWYKNLNNNSPEFKKYEQKYNKKISHIIHKAALDCLYDSINPSAIVIYGTDSDVVYRKDYSSKERSDYYIVPDTDEEKLFKYVCSYKLNNSEKDKKDNMKKDEVDFSPYMNKVQKKIKSNWHPPKGDESKNTVVFFSIDKQGNLVDKVTIVKSSGNREVDKAAIDAVNASAPFEKLPAKFKGNKVDIQFTFDYTVFGVGSR